MTIKYKIQFIHGRRLPGVDECDQGWLNVRLEPGVDETNLLQVINECFLLQDMSDGAFTYRVVSRDGDVDRLVA